MQSNGLSFHHPLAFWLGCLGITLGVLAHVPMFVHAAPMGFRMAGMPMSTTMWLGMALIPLGLGLAFYGLMPRLAHLRRHDPVAVLFHVADEVPLNRAHWGLVGALFVAVTVDVMKPATLGFVMPGMASEYAIGSHAAGTLALIALSGTAVGSVLWGVLADMFGRRAAILLSALMFIGTAICGAMPGFGWNLAMCFLMGLSAGGLLPITFTLMAETVPAHHRGWLLVALGGLGTAAGFLLASGAAAILEPLFSWRILWMLGLPTGLMLIFLNRYIPESPRYLASKGLNQQARDVLRRFCGEHEHDAGAVVAESLPHSRNGNWRELWRAPYSGITLGLIATGLAWGLLNFGFLLWLPTNLRATELDAQANAIIAQSALVALPGVLLVVWLYHSWSSIRSLVLFIVFTVISLWLVCLARGSVQESTMLLSTAIALLLVSASGVIAMLVPYASEIFPVHLRGTGAGIVAGSSKAGGITGALLGVAGMWDNLVMAAMVITVALAGSAWLLARHGIDTRCLKLENIHDAILRRNVPAPRVSER